MTRLRLVAGETFRSLRVRNFRLFFYGQIVSQSGTWMEMVAVIWLVFQLTDSGVALGLVTATQFLPMLLLGAWAGLLADRLDRHRLMLTTQLVFAGLAAVLAVLVVLEAYNVAVLYIFTGAFGLVTAIDNPNRRALVNDMVPREDVANAVGLNSTVMTASRVVGPTLAGLLIAGPGVAWCFVLNALSYLAVITALVRMDRAAILRSPRVERAKGQLREGFAYVRRTPELLLPLILVAVIGTLAFNYQVTLPLLAERSLRGDASTFTMLYASMSVGSLLGALQVARSRNVTMARLVRAGAGLAASLSVLMLAPVVAVAIAGAVAVGYHSIFLISGSNAVVQLRASSVMRGRVLALFSLVFLGTTPIGGPIVGWVSQTFTARAGLAVGAVATLLVVVWTARRLHHLPPTLQEAVSPPSVEPLALAAGAAPARR